MSMGLLYWILMVIWLVFGLVVWRGVAGVYGPLASNLLIFILFLILGWAQFGAPIK